MGLLRIFLAISVLLTHLGPGLSPVNGYLAVICFYVISGFYMSKVINEKYLGQTGWKSKFYLSRLLRLYPVYWAIAIFAFITFPLRFGHGAWMFDIDNDLNFMQRAAIASSNIFLWGLDAIIMLSQSGLTHPLVRFVGPAWSLAIELQFYLIAPFIVTRSLRFSLLLLLCTLAIRFSLLGADYDPWRYYFAPAVWCFFLMGHLSHRLSVLVPCIANRRLGVASIAAMLLSAALARVWATEDIDGAALWAFYILFAISVPFIFEMTKNSKGDLAVGALSYSLYIAHRPIFQFSLYLLGITKSDNFAELGASACLAVLFVTLCVAIAINMFIEKPMDKIRSAISNRSSQPAPDALSGMSAVAAAAITATAAKT